MCVSVCVYPQDLEDAEAIEPAEAPLGLGLQIYVVAYMVHCLHKSDVLHPQTSCTVLAARSVLRAVLASDLDHAQLVM